jgi:DNA-binding NarL/FixJ family response regulator
MQDVSVLRGAVVLVVSDDAESDRAIIHLLGRHGCATVRGEPGLLLDPSVRYDASVIDMRCHRGWGIGMIVALRTAELPCATLMVFASGEPRDVTAALGSGAVDCLVKPFVADDLLEGIANAILCTRRWRSRVSAARVHTLVPPPSPPPVDPIAIPEPITNPEPSSPAEPREREPSGPRIEAVVRRLAGNASLTPREGEVLFWLLHGHRYDDIASVLGVSTRTTEFHACNLLRKLDLDSRYDLTRLLAEHR